MTEQPERDLIAEIDNFITTMTTDGSCSANSDTSGPRWPQADDGHIVAVMLHETGGGWRQLSAAEPVSDIAALIGDPLVARRWLLHGVQVWDGHNSRATAPHSDDSTYFLHRLLSDIRDGNYAADEHDRDLARTQLGSPAQPPHIHGQCLITA
ncbi:MAG TPA: hypothetical protein VFG15_02980 [Amycolatopsis sp.]|nr:hypothetical protein [Amycolatopsis sp.]